MDTKRWKWAIAYEASRLEGWLHQPENRDSLAIVEDAETYSTNKDFWYTAPDLAKKKILHFINQSNSDMSWEYTRTVLTAHWGSYWREVHYYQAYGVAWEG